MRKLQILLNEHCTAESALLEMDPTWKTEALIFLNNARKIYVMFLRLKGEDVIKNLIK